MAPVMRDGATSRSQARITGWLLLLPAMVLLVAFPHWPALATAWHSLFTTPKGARPSAFVWVYDSNR